MSNTLKFLLLSLAIVAIMGLAIDGAERMWATDEQTIQAPSGPYHDHLGNTEHQNAEGDTFVAAE